MAQKKSDKAIEAALAGLEKRFGAPMAMKMSKSKHSKAKTIPTGRDQVDAILGGGFPVGKIVEIYGEEATGKTGLALSCAREVQSSGKKILIIDLEHALNKEYAEAIGLDWEELYISQPDSGEEAFEVLKKLINTGQFGLLIFDSVAAAVPRAELEAETGEAKMGLRARLMSQGLLQTKSIFSANDCTAIFINQLREDIGAYGGPKKPTGGNALKFYASQRIEVKNRGRIKEGEDIIGFKQEVKVIKNKVAPTAFQSIQEDMIYGKGVDDINSLVEACVYYGILERKGAFYQYNGSSIAQGIKKLRILLEENTDLLDELRAELESTKG